MTDIVTQPLELPTGTSADERLEAVHLLVVNGFGPIIEAGLANLVLPAQKEAFLVDAAHFAVFYLAVRLNDDRRNPPELKHTMQAFRTLHRTMEKEIVEQLHLLQTQHRTGDPI